MKKGNVWALLPIGVFLLLYLGTGILFEYVLNIHRGFSNIPITAAFLVALFIACLRDRKTSFDQKLEIMGHGVGDKDIFTMILIFLTAGVFVGVVGRTGAESVAYFMLSVIPPKFAVAVLFTGGCFLSLAMGTSVGTITLLTPIATAVSDASEFPLALCVASVVGGAMFGDNLSFISDTTIAACNGQGCKMKDKFKENFFITLPAAIVTLVIIIVISLGIDTCGDFSREFDLVSIIPYLLVLMGGIIGINVFVVLLIGIFSGTVITLLTGTAGAVELVANIGTGVSNMFETIIVTLLVAAIGALIKNQGGFDAILYGIRKIFKGKRGGQLGVGILVGLLDIATANNTVAIVMANPIAKEISSEYGISSRKTASLLDTFSCIFQGILPYGAQLLVAVSVVTDGGGDISTFDIIPYLFYPFLLAVSSVIFIIASPGKRK